MSLYLQTSTALSNVSCSIMRCFFSKRNAMFLLNYKHEAMHLGGKCLFWPSFVPLKFPAVFCIQV